MVSSPATQSPHPWLRYLLHPSCLAGIISVGVHGGIFAAGPTFSGLTFNGLVNPDPTSDNRQVDLIELTPQEQQQLLSFPQPFNNSQAGTFSTSDLFGEFGNTPSPQWDPTDQGAGTEGKADASDDSGTRDYVVNDLSILSQPSREATDDSSTESDVPPEEDDSTAPDSATDSAPDDTTEPSPASTDTNDSGDTPETPTEPGAASLERQPGNPLEAPTFPSDTAVIVIADTGIDDLTPEEQQQAYRYASEGTAPEDVDAQRTTWLQTGQAFAEKLNIPAIELTQIPAPSQPLHIPHTSDICLSQPPQPGIIGAWVSPEGKLLGDPTILQSTGYWAFNEQAMQFINSQDFSFIQRLTAYRFDVMVVNYELCSESSHTPVTPPAGDTPDRGTPASNEVVREPPAETAAPITRE